ncbi:TonB-dependent receptor plug domain-containing protein [Denitromonas sp.]|uniref:TonB-dependent receptor plug domain-containing protein n=1 Tax=Denitromonas sp. TaxID=2734609 RepID=UPI003A86B76B
MKHLRALIVGGSILLAGNVSAATDAVADPDLLAAYGGTDFVSIATGSRQPLRRAPAVASVVTRDDILALGARDLTEALAGVPGLHIAYSSLVFNPIFSFRGNFSQFNPQVLLLINGIPMTSVFAGDRGSVWGGMPVDNIERIEVIRGPGSALYGADAFTGVINVITRSPNDWQGTDVGVRTGSFNTRDVWLNHAGTAGPVKLGFYIGWQKTDGDDQTIAYDAQTGLDRFFGTQSSLAPGPISLGREGLDLGLDLIMGDWQLRAALKDYKDVGMGAGVANALDPAGRGHNERWTADLTWHPQDLAPDWDVTVQAHFLHMKDFSDIQLFPPGSNLGAGVFPQGMLGQPDKWERHGGLSATAVYTGWADHRVRIGGGYQKLDLYKVRETKNYRFVGLVPTPLPGGLTEVSAEDAFMRPHTRHNRYLYAQDEWSLSRNWTLTSGVRHDAYSDFGHTTNPRLALVWDAGYTVSAKLLYGRAFRAPSFVEQYNVNNPIALGNPDVAPEKMETWEAALTWQPDQDTLLSANLFQYAIRDTLRQVPNSNPATGSTAQNTGRVDGKGLEVEFSWRAKPSLKFSGYYAYQYSRDSETGKNPGNAPRQTAYLRADWRPADGFVFTPRLRWVADRSREPARPNQTADTRSALSDYVVLDLTVRAENVLKDVDLSLTVNNVADAAAYEPSQSPGQQDDFPLPGRTWLLSGTLRF